MSDLYLSIAVIIGSYLLGAVPTAYLLLRAIKGADIRKYGSGNVGISNFSIQAGKKWSVLLVLSDIWIKGILPVTVASDKVLGLGPWVEVGAGIASIVGHNWSVWLKFTGGRGMATVLGAVAALHYPLVVLYGSTSGMAWIAIKGRTDIRWGVLGAVILTSFSIALWVLDRPTWVVVFVPLFLAALLSGYALLAAFPKTAARARDSALWWGVAALLLPFWSLVMGQPAQVTLFCVLFLAVTAIKRLTSNRGTAAEKSARPALWKLIWNRLVYDRDIDERRAWVYRGREGKIDGAPAVTRLGPVDGNMTTAVTSSRTGPEMP